MAAKTLEYNATLVAREDHTAELATFHVRYDEPLPAPAYVPGQYVALGLNNETKPALGSVRRSMSIASAPQDGDVLRFYIRWVKHPESDNPLTHLLWPAKVGDRLFATRKPVGKFTVRDTLGVEPSRLQLLVAAGTGLAPFVSMARALKAEAADADMSKLVLLHGASYPADVCYRDELEGYSRDNGLHYFPTVSRVKEAPEWTGLGGRVEDFFLPERLEALEKTVGQGAFSPKNAGVLICGLQGTIARSIERLAVRGFVPFDRKIRKALELAADVPASLWWEQYDTTPVVDIDDPSVVASLRGNLMSALG